MIRNCIKKVVTVINCASVLSVCLLTASIAYADKENLPASRLGFYMNHDRKVAVKATGLSAVCPKTESMGSDVWKANTSGGFHDARDGSTTFLVPTGGTPVSGTCLSVYDSKGTKIHQMGAYPNPGSTWRGRFYGGYGCGDHQTPSSVNAKALKDSKKSTLYVLVERGTCVIIPSALSCIHSTHC